MTSPFEQRQQRELKEAWQHGRAEADRRGNPNPTTWRSPCCQAEVLKVGATVVCKACGRAAK